MRALLAGNPGAIRSPARIRESRASECPQSANAAVCCHACYRRWPSRSARGINAITIQTGAMMFVLTNDLKATNRSAVSFPATGYAGRRSSVTCAIEIGFLLPQAHDDRWPTGMTLREIRCDQVVHSATAAQGHQGGAECINLWKSIHYWLRPNACLLQKP
jgi:hypothetical protein